MNKITFVALVTQVVGSSMPLVGEHQAEDRQLIADMVLEKLNKLAENQANAPQRPTTIQPTQVVHHTGTKLKLFDFINEQMMSISF